MLVNYMTASRLIYGMALRGTAGTARHGACGMRTPHFAIVALFLVFALLGSITGPAATVLLLLGLFVVVNGALFVLQRR